MQAAILAQDAAVRKRLVAPTKKAVTLAPVHPNQGVEATYRRRLEAMVEEMHKSLIYWLSAAYRANEPEAMALDASPAATLGRVMRRLASRWQKRFDQLAPDLAAYFAKAVADRTDTALKAVLRKGGFTVEFKMTAAQNDAVQAVLAENVGLIKSIAAEHLQDVQGMVMRSVARGRDLGTLAKGIEERYGVTKRRAAFIARDQSNKATSVITATRQRELGITEAVWVHSAGGRHPRPSHVKAGKDKLRYDVTKGALIDGVLILPGELPNCRCVSRSVVPGFE